MDLHELTMQDKMRIVQELVPGKQITIAHIIANPDDILYRKLGLDPAVDYSKTAIGIVTMSPAETAVIAGDIAIKSSGVELGFVDRFSGTLIISTSASLGLMRQRTMNAPASVTNEMNRSSGPWCASSVMSNRSVVTRDMSRPVRFLS